MTLEDNDKPNEGEKVTPPNQEGEEKKEEGAKAVSREEFDQLKAQSEEYKAAAIKYQRDAAESQRYMQETMSRLASAAERGSTPNGNEEVDLGQMLSENPRAVLDEHFAARMGPLVQQNLELQATHARTLFEQSILVDQDQDLKEDYATYRDELNEWMKPIPLATKANPQAWKDGLDFIRAKHLNDIVNRRAAKKAATASDKAAFLEGPSAQANPKGKKFEMSDDMKAIAKGLGIPEEEYAKWAMES